MVEGVAAWSVEVPGFVAYEDPCTLDSASFSPVEVGVQALEAYHS